MVFTFEYFGEKQLLLPQRGKSLKNYRLCSVYLSPND